MNPSEQLAEMAAKNAKDIAKSLGNGVRFIPILTSGKSLLVEELEANNRAVLRWFAEEVEKRLEDKLCTCSYCYEFRGRHMTELLRELSIDSAPESRCCRICGEVIKGVIKGVPEADGLCGLCYDDQLNKRKEP